LESAHLSVYVRSKLGLQSSIRKIGHYVYSKVGYTHKHMYNLTLERPVFCYS